MLFSVYCITSGSLRWGSLILSQSSNLYLESQNQNIKNFSKTTHQNLCWILLYPETRWSFRASFTWCTPSVVWRNSHRLEQPSSSRKPWSCTTRSWSPPGYQTQPSTTKSIFWSVKILFTPSIESLWVCPFDWVLKIPFVKIRLSLQTAFSRRLVSWCRSFITNIKDSWLF